MNIIDRVMELERDMIQGKRVSKAMLQVIYQQIVNSDIYLDIGNPNEYEHNMLVETASNLVTRLCAQEEYEASLPKEEDALEENTALEDARAAYIEFADRDITSLTDKEYSEYKAAKTAFEHEQAAVMSQDDAGEK